MSELHVEIYFHAGGKVSGTLINPISGEHLLYCVNADSVTEVKQALEENYPDDILLLLDGITGERLTGAH